MKNIIHTIAKTSEQPSDGGILAGSGSIATSKFNDHIVELQRMIADAREMLPDHLIEVQLPDVDDWRSMAQQYVECDVRLEKMSKALEAFTDVFADVSEWIGGGDEEATQDIKTKLRKITFAVTEGMLRNNMITLTDAKRRGLVAEGEQFVLTPKDGETISTALIQPGNRLQARKPVAQFYERFSVKPGDRILMKEYEAGKWTLVPLKGSEDDLKIDWALLADLDDVKSSDKEGPK